MLNLSKLKEIEKPKMATGADIDHFVCVVSSKTIIIYVKYLDGDGKQVGDLVPIHIGSEEFLLMGAKLALPGETIYAALKRVLWQAVQEHMDMQGGIV